MFILAHLAIGLLLGKLTNNYEAALAGALFVDLDHIICYAKNGIIFDLKKIWKVSTSPDDPYGDQRNIFHNLLSWLAIAVAAILIIPPAGWVFAIGYTAHLVLDSLDTSDFRPLLPLSKINIKGSIKYFSHSETAITVCMLLVFLLV